MDYKTALQCARLSKDVYQGFADIKFEKWPGAEPVLVDKGSTDTQLAVLEDPSAQLAVIVFRGSDADKDWEINLQQGTREQDWTPEEKREKKEDVKEMVTDSKEMVYPATYGEPSRPVKMHSGFISAYLSVRDEIHRQIAQSSATRYIVTGHSLGGALATLCAVDLQYNFGDRISIEAYTFGSPRVGNAAFAESYNQRVPDTWRVVNGWDAVVGLPAPWQGYRHVEIAQKLERKFTWRIITGSFSEHRIDNYIEALKERA
ncbi:MAG: lipase family protein [Phormidesmis sp.]